MCLYAVLISWLHPPALYPITVDFVRYHDPPPVYVHKNLLSISLMNFIRQWIWIYFIEDVGKLNVHFQTGNLLKPRDYLHETVNIFANTVLNNVT